MVIIYSDQSELGMLWTAPEGDFLSPLNQAGGGPPGQVDALQNSLVHPIETDGNGGEPRFFGIAGNGRGDVDSPGGLAAYAFIRDIVIVEDPC